MTLRLAGLAALLLIAGCEASRPPAVPPPAPQAATPVPAAAPAQIAEGCAGSTESLTVTDRGIGGTGIGSEAPVVSDRGIGGTGATGEPGLVRGLPGTQTAERGGGGTGIVGVLTGFRSLCVDGVEVALDGPARVTVDGAGRASETLLVGEVAAIEARGAGNDLHAVSISVRHEVSGQIAAVAPAGNAIEVAGQKVLISPQTRVAAELRVGGWVAVSGLREPGGAIHASRLDGRAPGSVLVSGVVEQVDGRWQIGGLRLHLPPKLVPGADRVVLSGDFAGGELRVQQVNDEPLLPRRTALQHMFVESYPAVEGNEIKLAEGVEAGLGPTFGAPPPADQPIVLELVNTPANALLAVAWRPASVLGGPGHGKPASTPDMPASPQPAPLMQTPALTVPLAPAVATLAPATTTTLTTTTTPAVVTSTPVTTTTAVVATTATTTATTTVTSTTATSTSGDSSTSSSSTGGAPPVTSDPNNKGSAPGGSGSVTSPPSPPPHRSPPVSIGEGSGPASPPAPSKGAGSDGGSDGPAPPGGKAPGNSSSTGNGTAGSGGSGTGPGAGSSPGAGSDGGSSGSAPPAPGGGTKQGGKEGKGGKGHGGTTAAPPAPSHAPHGG